MRAKFDMLCSLKVQLINSSVTSIVLPYGSAVVKRIAVLTFPWLLLNVTVSNLFNEKQSFSYYK